MTDVDSNNKAAFDDEWGWFSLHAGQRMQAVNFFLIAIQGNYGKSLLRRRGEFIERSFAHCYETGGMRRTHLRKHNNIFKRQLIHVAGFNLSLILSKLLGAGTPHEWNNLGRMLILFLLGLFNPPPRAQPALPKHDFRSATRSNRRTFNHGAIQVMPKICYLDLRLLGA